MMEEILKVRITIDAAHKDATTVFDGESMIVGVGDRQPVFIES